MCLYAFVKYLCRSNFRSTDLNLFGGNRQTSFARFINTAFQFRIAVYIMLGQIIKRL